MDADERARRFGAAAKDGVAALPRVQRDVLAEIVRQLEIALDLIVSGISAASSEAAQRRLRQQRAEVERALEDFRQAAIAASTAGAATAWQLGIGAITTPFEAAGVSLGRMRIDARALMASQRLLTDRITDISTRALDKLNGALMQNIIGSVPLADTVTEVQKIMGGVPRARSMTVAYTEIGRDYSIAQDDAMQEAGTIVPDLRKRWLKSGKMHPRLAHVHAHNQIVRYDQPYLVDGEHLQFPRDPAGSPGNTINCGCHSIPVVDGSSFGASTIRFTDSGGLRKVVED